MQHKLLLFFFLLLLLFKGCIGRITIEKSEELKIVFATFTENDQRYGNFVLKNTGSKTSKFQMIKLIDANSGEEIPSSLLKLTNRNIEPDRWELGVFQIGKSGANKNFILRVEYEKNGKRYFTDSPFNSSHVWAKDLFVNEDFSALYLYFIPENSFSEETLSLIPVSINGKNAAVTDYSVLPATGGRSLICLKITPPQKLKHGERLFVSATLNDTIVYGGSTKVFYSFVAGQTQYSKVMRTVDLEYSADSIKLNIYNEADFRKCPAVIENVFVDGKNVTAQTTLPNEPFPPDLHNYDNDVRPVIVKLSSYDKSQCQHFDIDFKRLEPLRPSPVPEGYFDTQRFSFNVQHGVPYEIDGDDGLQGGVCILYAGLRPRPEITELIKRCISVYSADPSIPVYIYPHEGTKTATMFQLASCCDFIVTGQLSALIPSTFGKSQKFFEHIRYMRDLPVSWAGSVIADNDHQPSPKDLEWLTWGVIGAGSHGVFLTAPEKGDLKIAAECEKGAEQILRNIKSIKPLLGLSVPFNPPDYSCNQSGIHVDFLACGTDDLLMVALNERSTRSTFQESEPFTAAIRKDVECTFSLGEHFVLNTAIDPIHGKPVSMSQKPQGKINLKLPCFDNIQTVLLSRKKIENPVLNPAEIIEPSVVFLENPVVSLGTVRPDSEHIITIPIQSCTDKTITLTGNTISNSNSKSGEVNVSEIVLEAGTKNAIMLKYKSPSQNGKSVTNVRYTSPDLPEQEFFVYLCAEIENPVELSQTMFDFGSLVVGTKSIAKEVKLKSSDESVSISNVKTDNDIITDIVIAEDKKSFRFAAFSEQIGNFSAQLTVEITNQKNEILTQSLRCNGQFQNTVFATPPNISVVMNNQPKKYTIGVRYITNKPIKFVSVSTGKSIQYRADLEKFKRNPSIELTILPEILETGSEKVTIKGEIEGHEKFTLIIPVSAFSQQTQTDAKNNNE
jgi:hypothetical protein